MCDLEDYRDKVFDDFTNLQCLDGKDRDNQSIESDDDDEYGGESGEFDKDDDIAIPDDVLERLDPEIREKYKNGEISKHELIDFINDGDLAEGDEEGELDMDDEECEAALEEENEA